MLHICQFNYCFLYTINTYVPYYGHKKDVAEITDTLKLVIITINLG